MLEAKYFDSVYILPLFCSIVYYCCETAYHTPVTKAIKMFFKVVSFING